MSKIARSLALTLAIAAGVLAPATAAQADTITRHDAVGDVRSLIGDDEEGAVDPGITQGDITAISITHGSRSIRVALRLRQLDRVGDFVGTVVRLRNNRGAERVVTVLAGQGEWFGRTSVAPGRPRACRAARTQMDYVNERIVVRVPRRCLGNPTYVRGGAAMFNIREDFERLDVDDALSQGSLYNDIVLTKRGVRR